MDLIVEKLVSVIENSRRIVFFGGAGVSTESGIPDFRSTDGLYHQKYDFPPEEILSYSFFMENPEEFYRFYRDKMIYQDAIPNMAHRVLKKWELESKISTVITQNIDGLHQAAGSQNVIELHGSVYRNYCMSCKKSYDLEFMMHEKNVPECTECGGIVRPDVVLYEESLDDKILKESVLQIRSADTLIVAGTSLSVYPAAGLVRNFAGQNLIVINMSPTSLDQSADICIKQKIGNVLSVFMEENK